jgi:hypothetical protein
MAHPPSVGGRNFYLSLRGTVFVPKQSPIRGVGIASPSARNDSDKFLRSAFGDACPEPCPELRRRVVEGKQSPTSREIAFLRLQ